MPYIEQDKVDSKTREKLEAIIEKSYAGYWKKKRLFDIFFATLILLFFLPLMAVIAVIIVIDDPSAGPFYKQIRVGRHGKEFYMYKFRTMRADSESNGEPRLAKVNDERLTKVGKFLREHHLDELPQLWNILKGDMSIVGPRPRLVKDMIFY